MDRPRELERIREPGRGPVKTGLIQAAQVLGQCQQAIYFLIWYEQECSLYAIVVAPKSTLSLQQRGTVIKRGVTRTALFLFFVTHTEGAWSY